jgi:CRP/FNR family transcriptional regulator, anaerobic regulatory protein
MYNQIQASLSAYVSLSEAAFTAFRDKLTVRELPRKQFLLLPGEVCRFVAFINKGCLRYYYHADGEERTGQFFFENSWYTDYESFLTGQPSRQTIQALESTQLLLIPKTALYQLYDHFPSIERFGRLMAEQAYLGSRKNNVAFLTESPEERYLHLIANRPKVIERVPLRYIASYLGIQPESLSRIRKRLFDQRRKS